MTLNRAKALIFLVLFGCVPEVQSNQNLIQALWLEAQKITGEKIEIPEIQIVDEATSIHFGEYNIPSEHPPNGLIKVYYNRLYWFYNKDIGLTELGIYDVLAHEMLHAVYHVKYGNPRTVWKNPIRNHHCVMSVTRKDLQKLQKFIRQRLNSNDTAVASDTVMRAKEACLREIQ